MDFAIKGRKALVTGSSAGIGKACAEILASEGAAVAICGRRAEQLAETEKELKGKGYEVVAVQGDVTKAEDVKKIVDATASAFGAIDILVNNAGSGQRGSFEELSDDAWQAGINLNLMSTIRFSRVVIPFMKKQQWGRIINLTSIVGKMIALPPLPNTVEYTTTKASLIALTKTMAEDLAKYNILVNSVSPGPILTPLWEQNAVTLGKSHGKAPQEILDERASHVPLNRFGRPREIAYMVTFLCSNRAEYITGTNINIDGGSYRGIA